MTATCWIDPGGRGAPYESVIRFTGHRLAAGAAPSAADRFAQDETVRLVPGSGPVAVTARVQGISAGQWLVRVRPLALRAPARVLDPRCLRHDGRLLRLRHVLWTRGNPVTPGGSGELVRTRAAALASAPGIITGSWAAFAVAGLAVLAVLLARSGADIGGMPTACTLPSVLR